MGQVQDNPPSWKGFFFGCFVLLFIAGSIVGTFLYFSKKNDERIAGLEEKVMGPYWQAVKAEDYSRAYALRTAEWREKHTEEQLASAYQEARKEHGELQKTWIHVANEYYEPGQKGDACLVESIYEFKDGWRGRIHFHLKRPDDNSSWVIDKSAPTARLPLGDGPY